MSKFNDTTTLLKVIKVLADQLFLCIQQSRVYKYKEGKIAFFLF